MVVPLITVEKWRFGVGKWLLVAAVLAVGVGATVWTWPKPCDALVAKCRKGREAMDIPTMTVCTYSWAAIAGRDDASCQVVLDLLGKR